MVGKVFHDDSTPQPSCTHLVLPLHSPPHTLHRHHNSSSTHCSANQAYDTSGSLPLLLLFTWAALAREQGSEGKVQVSAQMPSRHRHFSEQLLKEHLSHVLSFDYAWSVFMQLPRWHWNPPVNAGDMRLELTLWVGRSPGEGNGNPLQYCCLENPMDKGAWWALWGHKELDTTCNIAVFIALITIRQI